MTRAEPMAPAVKLPTAGVPVPTSGPRALDGMTGRRYAVTEGSESSEPGRLVDQFAFYCRLPHVRRRDQYDYPKVVNWHWGNAALERVWCLADRDCAAECGWSIAAHTFYVRVSDYTHTRSIGRRLSVPTTADYHPACVPARLAPALLRLEVPQ